MEKYFLEIKDKLEEARTYLPHNTYLILLSVVIQMAESEIKTSHYEHI